MNLSIESRPSWQTVPTLGGIISGQHVHEISISGHILVVTIALLFKRNVRTLTLEGYGSSLFTCVGGKCWFLVLSLCEASY